MAEFGPVMGRPVLWFHGTPGGRHQIPESLRATLHDVDARIIVIERPGYGDSTRHLYREVLDVTADVDHILYELGLDRFGVAALSGGGPYALAVAHAHPDRVVAASVLGGVVPHVGPESHAGGWVSTLAPLSGLARRANQPVGAVFGGLARVMRPVAGTAFRATTRLFPPGDRLVFESPGMQEMFLTDIIRTARGGLPGPALDLVLFTRDWGFRLADLAVPVHFWHGDADPIVTLAQAEKMAGVVPRSSFNLRPGESHLGGFAASTEAIGAILGHWPD
jgi:pimeloyl-ACP methyl ester carboxylesterase